MIRSHLKRHRDRTSSTQVVDSAIDDSEPDRSRIEKPTTTNSGDKSLTALMERPRRPKRAISSVDIDEWPCLLNHCSKIFLREADLKRHQRTSRSHATSGGKCDIVCPTCRAIFSRTDALRRHQKAQSHYRQSDGALAKDDETDSHESEDEFYVDVTSSEASSPQSSPKSSRGRNRDTIPDTLSQRIPPPPWAVASIGTSKEGTALSNKGPDFVAKGWQVSPQPSTESSTSQATLLSNQVTMLPAVSPLDTARKSPRPMFTISSAVADLMTDVSESELHRYSGLRSSESSWSALRPWTATSAKEAEAFSRKNQQDVTPLRQNDSENRREDRKLANSSSTTVQQPTSSTYLPYLQPHLYSPPSAPSIIPVSYGVKILDLESTKIPKAPHLPHTAHRGPGFGGVHNAPLLCLGNITPSNSGASFGLTSGKVEPCQDRVGLQPSPFRYVDPALQHRDAESSSSTRPESRIQTSRRGGSYGTAILSPYLDLRIDRRPRIISPDEHYPPLFPLTALSSANFGAPVRRPRRRIIPDAQLACPSASVRTVQTEDPLLVYLNIGSTGVTNHSSAHERG